MPVRPVFSCDRRGQQLTARPVRLFFLATFLGAEITSHGILIIIVIVIIIIRNIIIILILIILLLFLLTLETKSDLGGCP